MSEGIKLSDDNLKEIFALFSSPTKDEYEDMVYNKNHSIYYKNEKLHEEYELTQEKREYALDAWRAVLLFLYRHGYQLKKDGIIIDLKFAEDELIAPIEEK